MKERNASAQVDRHLNVLNFWHKIEFFIPYDLQRHVFDAKDAEWSVLTLSKAQLEGAKAEDLWAFPLPPERKLSSFDVYLGVFDKAELAEVTRRLIRDILSEAETYDQDARGELEGPTCFARIRVSAEGKPLLDDVAVSTAPWALGRIQMKGLEGLDFDKFQEDLVSLKRELKTFRTGQAKSIFPNRSQPPSRSTPDPTTSQPIDGTDLLSLLNLLYDWAGYRPSGHDPKSPVIVVRAKSFKEKVKPPNAKTHNVDQQEVVSVPGGEDGDDDDVSSSDEAEISILNSFYAQDIARAIDALKRGTASAALQEYLTPLDESRRTDLYKPEGWARIKDRLQPHNWNAGHWLDQPAHAMSLMQQFAINSIYEKLGTKGIFSVNGPPGTGKTTLLRDIFAENIVRRARALAQCPTAGDAFLRESVTLTFKGVQKECKIAILREELAGFEMVVASSNNAAVENISQDLPKCKSLGKSVKDGEKGWRDEAGKAKVRYLQPVARNLAARNNKGEYEELSSDDEPWGLISCALGKKRNRDAFVQGINFAGPNRGEAPPKGFDPAKHQSLWIWRDGYTGVSFRQAQQAFKTASKEVAQLLDALNRYAALHTELNSTTRTNYIAAAKRTLQQVQLACAAAQADVERTNEEWTLCNSQLELLKSEEALIGKRRPGWWERLTQRGAQKKYDEDMGTNHNNQGAWLQRKYSVEEPRLAFKRTLGHVITAVTDAQTALAARETEWSTKLKQCRELAEAFPQASCPAHLNDLEKDRWQINGLWQSEVLNEKRAALFAAALQLHEAWLAEVLRKGGGFAQNIIAIRHLLSGKRLQESQFALALWRSLFMVVPVVSSTFASFANQFRDLGANSLGWLFIDEAGQAVPQAAVGALWRAQRAVVVGDPLQIEPVFTVPIKLIEALAESSSLPPDMDVSPHRVSVQSLADHANALGAQVGTGGSTEWIGSPLRVHRRCVDPMFSIANEIAYEGKMIFFAPDDPSKRLPPADSLDIGSSSWVHAPGEATEKQMVPVQIDLVHQALLAVYQRTGKLPPIYIISPFKRIKDELIERLSSQHQWASLADVQPPKVSDLRDWCKKRIGTVHTFQGKEESIVWLVLGCDENTVGAASWAAGKPNLLNVALTRAKHRCFVIGDVNLWGGLRYFESANGHRLPRISPQKFVELMAPTLVATA